MTDQDPRVARREIADTLVRALERRHELLDVDRGGRGLRRRDRGDRRPARHVARRRRSGAEVVVRPAHQGVAAQDRRRTRGPEQPAQFHHGRARGLGGQPGAASLHAPMPTATSSPRAPATCGRPATGPARRPGISTTRSGRGCSASTPKRRPGWWRSTARRRSAWCSATWSAARSTCGYGFTRLPQAGLRHRRAAQVTLGDGRLLPGGAVGGSGTGGGVLTTASKSTFWRPASHFCAET